MKVYIVTDGCYSDYMIEKVFSNREAAEEYKKWRHFANDIEEYEIYDEPFTKDDGEKVMFIRVQGTVYPEAVVDIRVETRPELRYEGSITHGTGMMTYKRPGVFTLYTYRLVPADKWEEEKYKAKLTKALYDYAAMARSLFAEGASVRDVELALRNKDEEDV